MKAIFPLLLLAAAGIPVSASTQAAAPWPIAYTESAGGTSIPDAWAPWPLHHSKIIHLDLEGNRSILVDPGPKAAAWDHMVSLDGQWLYYAQTRNLDRGHLSYPARPTGGSDIWRFNLHTGVREQITFQGALPYSGRKRDPSLGVWNMGPCPLADRLIFTSDREIPGQNQLWSCDLDGKNVEKVGYLNLQNALHPVRLSDGRVLFSSNEGQGQRISISWGLWTILPDGRDFEPFFSAFWAASIIHWHAEAANKQVVSTVYYAQNNDGFGSLFAAPLDFPGYEHRTTIPATRDDTISRLFMPKGSYELTPWTVPWDTAAPLGPDGTNRVGKLTHPAVCPDPTKILVTHSPGPVNHLNRPTNQPGIQAGIYLSPVGQPTAGPESLVKVIDDPAVHEWQAQALVPYAQIFGSNPKQEPWLPNAGSEHLPAGTPYALVGTSSLYVRETDTLVQKPPYGGVSLQGGNMEPFDNEEIARLRILTMEWPTSHGDHKHRTALAGDERLRILGEVDVRRFDAAGHRIKDPAGNPDTSFLAKIRADEPFTFQLLDKEGQALTTAQTWHHVRPGERKYDCRGCHAHTAPEVRFEFEDSWAAKNPPADFTKSPGRLVEFTRDVKPILKRHAFAFDPSGSAGGFAAYRAAFGNQVGIYDSRHSPLIKALTDSKATAEEIRTACEWIDTGCLLNTGEGLRDDTKPTLFIHSPRRTTAPITQVVVSAADAELNPNSLTVSLNGKQIQMAESGDGIWTATVPQTAKGELAAQVRDWKGNVTRQVRTFGPAADEAPAPPRPAVTSPPAAASRPAAPSPAPVSPRPPARTPEAIYVGLDGDNVGPGRSSEPDGKLDHHIRLTGLAPKYDRIIVHAGAVKWSNEAEIPLVLGRPLAPGSPLGILDLWFAPQGTEGVTEFTVWIRSPDGSEDKIVTTLPTGQ